MQLKEYQSMRLMLVRSLWLPEMATANLAVIWARNQYDYVPFIFIERRARIFLR